MTDAAVLSRPPAHAEEGRRGGVDHAEDGWRQTVEASENAIPLGHLEQAIVAGPDQIELLVRSPVVAVMRQMECALHREGCGEETGRQAAHPPVERRIRVEDAVNGL